MRKTILAVALTALLGLTAGACGGDKKEGTDSPDSTPTSGAAAATIKASGTTWAPDEVIVKAGEAVEWDVTAASCTTSRATKA